jgi:hypothetical protein
MEEKKLFAYLQRLSRAEWEAFGDFLRHPQMGDSKVFYKYLLTLKRLHFSHEEMTEAEFNLAVNPKGPKSLSHMRRQYALMLDKLLDFLALATFKADESLRREARLRALASRGWQDALQEQFAEEHKKFQRNPYRSGADYLGLAKLAILHGDLGPPPLSSGGNGFYQFAIALLDQGYEVAGWELASKANNLDAYSAATHAAPKWLTTPAPPKEETASQVPLDSENPIAQLLQAIHRLHQPGALPEREFQQARACLDQALPFLKAYNKSIFQDIYGHLISYAGRNLQHNPTLLRPALNALYNGIVNHDLLLGRDSLSPVHLLNIVQQALLDQPLPKALAYLAKLQPNLPEGLRDITHDVSRAQLYFHHQQFQASYALLNTVEIDVRVAGGFELLLSHKTYQLIVAIECADYEAVDRYVPNFHAWLDRHKDSQPATRRRAYHQFVYAAQKITEHLEALAGNGPVQNAAIMTAQLRRKFNQQHPVFYKWLASKMLALEAMDLPGAPKKTS